MSDVKKYFGTDGIRGCFGDATINPQFMVKLGWAAGKVLANGAPRRVLIGKDTRISGYVLESALEAGLLAAGVDTVLLGPMPTPAVAYLVRTLRASAGIVISASHNPFHDNGIKFFSAAGQKLSDAVEQTIEGYLEKPLDSVDSSGLGKASRVVDAPGRYIEFCKSTISTSVQLHGVKLVVDCANGATYHIAPQVFRELGAQVVELATTPDGFNINANCGSTHIVSLQQKVRATQADLGIAFDGDGDRLIMVDHTGDEVDGDELLYIIARDLHQNKQLHGGVVGTQMSNLGLEDVLLQLKIPFARARVGDRYVLSELLQLGWRLGGESSGHIICLDKTTTGDGLIAALQVLQVMHRQQTTLRALRLPRKFPQIMVNVPVQEHEHLLTHNKVTQVVEEVQAQLPQPGRVLLRPSGTEPVVRVMVEAQEEAIASQAAHQIADVIRSIN